MQEKRFLIDCGLFQGLKKLRERNWKTLSIKPAEIDAVVLTHAHLDHTGYLPRLVKTGFSGTIYCSQATFDLCKILLPDSGYIQEEDAARANRYGYTKHSPALPLYTKNDALHALEFFEPVNFANTYRLSDSLSFSLHRAGHILGASFVRITHNDGTSILFSGDIGRVDDPVMKPPTSIPQAEYLVIESTYGDRLHDAADPKEQLVEILNRTIERGGTLIIPAFAVGRAQSILYYLSVLKQEGRLPQSLPVFLDSPMAIDASQLLCKHSNEHQLNPSQCMSVCSIADYTRTVDESKAIDELKDSPKVIISASGMLSGGRVLHHLKSTISDKRNTVLLVGYQAAGTRGEQLLNNKSTIKIHGEQWAVRAEVVKMDNLSAHADQQEILAWLTQQASTPRRVFIVHGEPRSAECLKEKIQAKFNWDVLVPEYLYT